MSKRDVRDVGERTGVVMANARDRSVIGSRSVHVRRGGIVGRPRPLEVPGSSTADWRVGRPGSGRKPANGHPDVRRTRQMKMRRFFSAILSATRRPVVQSSCQNLYAKLGPDAWRLVRDRPVAIDDLSKSHRRIE